MSIALVSLGLIILGRVVFNSFVGDDFGYINHPYIIDQNFTGLFIGSSADLGGSSPVTGHFYRPLMLLQFSLIDFFFGPNPFFYHLASLLLHLGNAVFVFYLFKRHLNKRLAIILSFLFLLHPITVETYAYTSNTQDLLFVFFGMISFLITTKEKLSNGKFFISLAFLFLSLLSKETGVVFLIINAFYLYIVHKTRNVYKYLSFVAVFLIYLLVRVGIAQVTISDSALSEIGNMTFVQRITLVPSILSYYLSTTIYPKDLAIGQVWTTQEAGLLKLLFPLVTLVLIIIAALKLKTKKLKLSFIFFLVWFVIGMIPHLQIVPLEMTVADRWFYFPLIGLLGMVGATISNFETKRKIYYTSLGFLVVTTLIISVRTFVRLGDFRSAIALYAHDTKVTKSYLLEHSLGFELMERKRMGEAFTHLNNSVNLYKTPFNTNSMGVYFYKMHNYKKAKLWFGKSISLGGYYLAFSNLSNLHIEKNDFHEAAAVLRIATKKFPESSTFYHKLSIAEYKVGNNEAAIDAAGHAYSLSPTKDHEYVFHTLIEGKDLNIK